MKEILFKISLALIFLGAMSNECYATTALYQNTHSETSAGKIDVGHKRKGTQEAQSRKKRKGLLKRVIPTRKQIIISIVLLSIGAVIFGGFGLVFLSVLLDVSSTLLFFAIVLAFIGLLVSFLCLRGVIRRLKKLKELKEETTPNNLGG